LFGNKASGTHAEFGTSRSAPPSATKLLLGATFFVLPPENGHLHDWRPNQPLKTPRFVAVVFCWLPVSASKEGKIGSMPLFFAGSGLLIGCVSILNFAFAERVLVSGFHVANEAVIGNETGASLRAALTVGEAFNLVEFNQVVDGATPQSGHPHSVWNFEPFRL